ncbi:4'-phosphopantetheinyl transferase family protein [Streptomyces sp. enrichment culture]|uniref:4'-phosphopantetheinyl transferase family protein n=1 Tax=Streptomyces sp. enrichment culture TaxID=1795815 RepID=UPI003F55CD74
MTTSATLRPVELGDGIGDGPPAVPGEDGRPALWLVRADRFRAVAARSAASVLDADEQKRAAMFRRAGDRDAYLAGHVGLRMLLGACLGLPPADVPLERQPCVSCRQPHGRPVVRGNPLHFSLSHTGGLCLLAFAAAPVGVDIEAVPAPAVAEEVKAALHPREVAELDALGAADRPAAFTRTWVRKEAYLKGLGTGLERSPSLDYLGTAPGAVTGPPGWAIGDVAVDDGYAAAVAVAVEGESVRVVPERPGRRRTERPAP